MDIMGNHGGRAGYEERPLPYREIIEKAVTIVVVLSAAVFMSGVIGHLLIELNGALAVLEEALP